jgi:hypothetical protein
MTPDIKTAITEKVNELILGICPDAGFTSKYGGTLIEAVAGDPNTAVGGLFFYESHASFEFSKGADLDDPNGHLEGKGKFRRHLKLKTAQDIEQKQLRTFLQQVF